MSSPILSESHPPSIYDLSPPHGAITESDHGGYVVIAGWIMMCFFSLSVLTRLMTRFIPVRVYGSDDIIIAIAMVIGIAQTAAIHVSASNGLGRHIHTLSYDSYEIFAKAYYASDLLFLVTIYLAKVSLVVFIMRLTPSHNILYFCYGFITILTMWMLASVFSLAFQCSLPQPWDSMQLHLATCEVNIAGLYYSIGAVDILSDIVIIVTPTIIVWNVQISRAQRFTVIGVFGSRLAVCTCSALLLASIPEFIKSSDRSWEAVTPQIWRQVVQCLSLITACIPCLRPFLASLESGFIDSSMRGVIGKTYGGGSGHDTGDRKGPSSFAMTSFATRGRRATTANGTLGKNSEIETNTLIDLERNGNSKRSLLSPKSAATEVHEPSGAPKRNGTLRFGHQTCTCSQVPSTTTITSNSRRDSKNLDTFQGRRAGKVESTEVPPSRNSGGLDDYMQPVRMGDGRIRETREVLVSIEHSGSHLVDGFRCAHGPGACSNQAIEAQFMQEHSTSCSSYPKVEAAFPTPAQSTPRTSCFR
ncbi:hypothetical protein EPUS_06366 [Endocarpon pusillum Z07020]|uniref:Rhodopsin domain-containing protein n=1 Tax=Endocarpon pusillum (strain Z07020 / HMAS-L-300199) TaxID=1263415 RepID=U1G9D5_ENDPU|nr:uncharacterized protein EPUS_06366 [Endocarpon pusillum Z07020]ERF74097.1 hypothetical protein EPUS_06366 [Endocarpon pusillum Z07020]